MTHISNFSNKYQSSTKQMSRLNKQEAQRNHASQQQIPAQRTCRSTITHMLQRNSAHVRAQLHVAAWQPTFAAQQLTSCSTTTHTLQHNNPTRRTRSYSTAKGSQQHKHHGSSLWLTQHSNTCVNRATQRTA